MVVNNFTYASSNTISWYSRRTQAHLLWLSALLLNCKVLKYVRGFGSYLPCTACPPKFSPTSDNGRLSLHSSGLRHIPFYGDVHRQNNKPDSGIIEDTLSGLLFVKIYTIPIWSIALDILAT